MNRDIFAHFDQSGAFAYLFESHIGNLPPIPLADDGLPRTVKMQPMPAVAENEQATPHRDGSWSVVATEPTVPSAVTARQLRRALIAGGIMPDAVTAAIRSAITDPAAQAAALTDWEYASTYERNNPLIAQMATVFGLSDEQVDALSITSPAEHAEFVAMLRASLVTRVEITNYPEGYDHNLEPGADGYIEPIYEDRPTPEIAAQFGFTPVELIVQ